MVNYEYMKELFRSDRLKWRRVRDLICVHAFFDGFYVNLCRYFDAQNNLAISVNVDNVRINKNDILDVSFKEGTAEYTFLNQIYLKALETCERVDSVQSA